MSAAQYFGYYVQSLHFKMKDDCNNEKQSN